MERAMLKEPMRKRLKVVLCHAGLKPSEAEGVIEQLLDVLANDPRFNPGTIDQVRRGE